ncbi:hypothetical protein MMC34_008608 [Xylographa carneopallida]|nr:hypothetical protein [Xylographa carneopallida]
MPELARTQVTAALQKGQDVPFEQLEQMRQHGGITKQQIRKLVEKAKAKSFKRENKNRPMEMSSKRPVPRLREVVEGTKSPCMLCPEQQLSCLQKTKNADRKKELQLELRKVQQQIKEAQAQRQRQALHAERKKQEKAAVKEGKKVYFPKRSEKKRQELIRRYEELKATGRLEKAMTKRRKKNALKDHRYMPGKRKAEA